MKLLKMNKNLRGGVIIVATCMVAAFLPLFAGVTKYAAADGETLTIAAPGIGNNLSRDEVELNLAAGSTLILPTADANGVSVIRGRIFITGSGTVTVAAPDGYTGTTILLDGAIAAENPADITLHVSAPTVTAIKIGFAGLTNYNWINSPFVRLSNVTFANPEGKFHLFGLATVNTLPVGCVIDDHANIGLTDGNPLGMKENGEFTLDRYDILVLQAGAIPNGCTIKVNSGRTLSLKPCNLHDSGVWSYPWDWGGTFNTFEHFKVHLNGRGSRVLFRNTLENDFRFNVPVTGKGEAVFRSDWDQNRVIFRGTSYFSKYVSAPIVVPIDTEKEIAIAAENITSWTNKVESWFDASDVSTQLHLDHAPPVGMSNVYTNNYPYMIGWLDKKKGSSSTWLLNRRMLAFTSDSDYCVQVNPFVVKGGLNGMDYVSFGGFGNTVAYPHCPGASGWTAPEARRIEFHSASSAVSGHDRPTDGKVITTQYKYCIMVFGSQNGGGRALLKATDGTMNRIGTTLNDTWIWGGHRAHGYKYAVDGTETSPYDSKPNGGWQIVSIDMSMRDTPLAGLGSDSGSAYGGQNYAEVIFFKEVPTEFERQSCERYLAHKWGLVKSYNDDYWDKPVVQLSGRGVTYLFDANRPSTVGATEFVVYGNFTGILRTREGITVTIPDMPKPPTAVDIPKQDKITGWYDPSLDGAITSFEGNDDVNVIYPRSATALDQSDSAVVMNGWGRPPTKLRTWYFGASGVGPELNWVEYNIRNGGNTLRTARLKDGDKTGERVDVAKLTARSVFMSIETSLGGGNPFGDNVYFDQKIKARNGSDFSAPIWNSNNTMKMTHTWLDNQEVDGTKSGFNGRGEILGFEMESDLTSQLFLGYFNNNHYGYERIGETILYSTTLNEAERTIVNDYLAAKWLGDMQGKYSDLTSAFITGGGDIRCKRLDLLPKLGEPDSPFTGKVIGVSELDFTIDSTVALDAAVDAVAMENMLLLEDNVNLMVHLPANVKDGTYTLITALAGSALDKKNYNLTVKNGTGKNFKSKILATDTTLSFQIVCSKGFVLMFK